MNIFFIWIIGWIILSLGYYFYNVYIPYGNSEYKLKYITKKLIIYNSIKVGIWSWIGIIVYIALFIVYWIIVFDEYIQNKLNE